MAKIMDPILPIDSILGYWAIILGSFGLEQHEEAKRDLWEDPKVDPPIEVLYQDGLLGLKGSFIYAYLGPNMEL